MHLIGDPVFPTCMSRPGQALAQKKAKLDEAASTARGSQDQLASLGAAATSAVGNQCFDSCFENLKFESGPPLEILTFLSTLNRLEDHMEPPEEDLEGDGIMLSSGESAPPDEARRINFVGFVAVAAAAVAQAVAWHGTACHGMAMAELLGEGRHSRPMGRRARGQGPPSVREANLRSGQVRPQGDTPADQGSRQSEPSVSLVGVINHRGPSFPSQVPLPIPIAGTKKSSQSSQQRTPRRSSRLR